MTWPGYPFTPTPKTLVKELCSSRRCGWIHARLLQPTFSFFLFFVRWAGRDGTRNTRYTSLSNKYVLLLLLRIYYRLVF
jgi:hypothetical protein